MTGCLGWHILMTCCCNCERIYLVCWNQRLGIRCWGRVNGKLGGSFDLRNQLGRTMLILWRRNVMSERRFVLSVLEKAKVIQRVLSTIGLLGIRSSNLVKMVKIGRIPCKNSITWWPWCHIVYVNCSMWFLIFGPLRSCIQIILWILCLFDFLWIFILNL